MNNKTIIALIITAAALTTSCGDFLKEYSTQLNYATSAADMEELLIGGGYLPARSATAYYNFAVIGEDAPDFPWIHVMDDDVADYLNHTRTYVDNVGETLASFYTWQQNPFMNLSGNYKNVNWERFYKHIAVTNVVIGKIDEFTQDPEELRKRIKGEALFLRANFYFLLVNFYAKPYNAATADTDLGVPLKITDEIEDKYYSRNTVAQVYAQIVKDLEESVSNLAGIAPESVFQATEAAAHTLLSRVYLYMGEWEKSVQHANSVTGHQLLDLVGRDPALDFTFHTSPETIFTQGSHSMFALMKSLDMPKHCFQVSEDLYNSFDDTDLRKDAFFLRITGSYAPMRIVRKLKDEYATPKVSDNCLIRYAEVFLNKAEALAMTDKTDEAIRTIQELRAKRFEQGNYANAVVDGQAVEVSSLAGEQLVKFIREERRRELCFEGFRWFDLRRYAVSPKYKDQKEIRHEHFIRGGTTSEVFLLKEFGQDNGWVLPIPDYVITFNDGEMVDNPREERSAL